MVLQDLFLIQVSEALVAGHRFYQDWNLID